MFTGTEARGRVFLQESCPLRNGVPRNTSGREELDQLGGVVFADVLADVGGEAVSTQGPTLHLLNVSAAGGFVSVAVDGTVF